MILQALDRVIYNRIAQRTWKINEYTHEAQIHNACIGHGFFGTDVSTYQTQISFDIYFSTQR